MRIFDKIRTFLSDVRGNVATIFSIALAPLTLMAGGAVDFNQAMGARARLAAAHRDACVGGDDDLPVRRGRGPAGWGVLLYRFMIGAETTVIVLLLWVAAADRAPAVGCRGGHIRISI